MEPDLGGQEKTLPYRGVEPVRSVAMEPDLGGQEKFVDGKVIEGKLASSQWSLTLEVRKRRPTFMVSTPSSMSQWSLTLEVRKSGDLIVGRDEKAKVAMEPDLGGQEKDRPVTSTLVYHESQWSLTLEVRKRTRQIYRTVPEILSQWSLTLEVRKRWPLHPTVPVP